MRRSTLGLALLATNLLVVPVQAQTRPPTRTTQELPAGSAAALGFSPERLERLGRRFDEGVANGEIPGAVIMVLRDGKIAYRHTVGSSDRATRAAMKEDTVFWLASMTKPFTSVAAMILVEEGRLRLDEPIATYLPELHDLQVLVDDKQQVPHRQPTVQDLFRHTAGFVYGQFGNTKVHKAYLSPPVLDPTITSAEMIRRLAKLPLAHQPGEAFEYSVATDVLGRIVEVVSGMPLDRFIKMRIAAPLDLRTLKFHVDQGQSTAWGDPIAPGVARQALEAARAANPPLLSGGGGLYGSARDYSRFAQMLLNGGELNGVRILSPHSVDLMRSNHLPDGIEYPAAIVSLLGVIAPSPAIGQGFGLGFAVRTDPGLNPLPGSKGDFFWAGAGGTYFWVDPAEKLVVVMMTAQPDGKIKAGYRQLTRALVYQALIRSYQAPVSSGGTRVGTSRVVTSGQAADSNGIRP